MNTFLYDIQAVARDFLLTDEDFRDFLILAEDSLDIAKDVENAAMNDVNGKKRGLVVLIQMFTGSCSAPNAPDIHFQPAQIAFDIIENVSVNRGSGGCGRKGLVVAEQLLAVMANFKSLEPGMENVYFYHDRDAIDRIDVPEMGWVVHRARMNCAGGGSVDQTETVETPVWSRDGAYLSLTCATPGAQIWWALDARPFFGGSGNPANVGALYSAPFEFADGIYYARAYKIGMRASLLALYDASSFITVPAGSPLVTTPAGEPMEEA